MPFQVGETELLTDSYTVRCPIPAFDHPHRCLVVVLAEEPSLYRALSTSNPELYEGIHYEGGAIRLLGSTLEHGPKRALVIVLNEEPRLPVTPLPSAIAPSPYPIQF